LVDTGVPIAIWKKIKLSKLNVDNISWIHNIIKRECEYESFIKVLKLISDGNLEKKNFPYFI
jgi:hypothetical protein